jgi:hypothetical protein
MFRDDVDEKLDAAFLAQRVTPLGEGVACRKVQQWLAAEQREHEFLGFHLIEAMLGPVDDPGGRLG